MLKEKRSEYELTQEQLSEKIFVSRKTISNWETGKTTPDIDSLIRLADLFNLSLDNLLLEGSDIVENIKKIEAAKAAKKYFSCSWLTNMIFILIIGTQRIYESSPDSCVKCYTMFLPFLLIKINVFS